MSSGIRSINPAFWQHPRICTLSVFDRCLLLYCITSLADDEGRFRIYPKAIAQQFLSETDAAQAAEIAPGLTRLEEAGLIECYGQSGDYAWFPGWFEHQNIPQGRRSESSLPAPPHTDGQIPCWADAEQAREDMAKAKDCPLQQVRADDAVRWVRNHTVDDPSTNRQPDVTRRDVTRLDKQPSSKTVPVSEPIRKAETRKQRQQRLLAEEEALREQFSADELQLVDAYIEIVDSDLKRGTTPGGRVTRMQQLIDVANDINELVEAEGLPPERAGRAFLYGLEQACNAGAANKNYVKTCAISSLRRRE